MTQPVDQANAVSADARRRRAMSAVTLAPAGVIEAHYAVFVDDAPPAIPVRGPEVGLVMLRGRTGGGGAPFNLGEASVCRATVRLESGEVGHAMILGRDAGRARIAAHLDALWQHPLWQDRVEAEIVDPALAADAEETARRAEETAATRVDFFTMARGED